MNPVIAAKKPKISRLSFLLRYILIVAAISIAVLAQEVSRLLLARNSLLALVVVLVSLSLLLATLYFSFSRAVLPRLRDIGFYGPFCIGIAVLWFVPPVNLVLTLALLLVPSNAIPDR